MPQPSGLIGVICAFKGYEVFAKKLSKFGCIISVVMALLVIILAWYCCLAKDVYSAYQSWFADGEMGTHHLCRVVVLTDFSVSPKSPNHM